MPYSLHPSRRSVLQRIKMLLAVGILAALIAGIYVALFYGSNPNPCSLSGIKWGTTEELHSKNFGHITLYLLPAPNRMPNSILPMQDGSVWFGEPALPGLGHLFPNGTLVEYPFPFQYPQTVTPPGVCPTKSDMWSLVYWNGSIWAPDPTKNQLVGINPDQGVVNNVSLPTPEAYPYTLALGPGNTLWFTELRNSAIGELFPNGTLLEHSLESSGRQVPAQLTFVNDTLGYYVDIGAYGYGHLYSFNPENFSPVQVGGDTALYSPNSVSVSPDGVWVTEHGGSEVAFFNDSSKEWTFYPTSPVSYIDSTLPYFIQTNGTLVWFNEHYANRLALIDGSVLTEFALSETPILNFSQIDNVLTFSVSGSRVWFTEFTQNAVGYLDYSQQPDFRILGQGTALALHPGGSSQVSVQVTGSWKSNLSVSFSDSESVFGIPTNLTVSELSSPPYPQGGTVTLRFLVTAGISLQPGRYTLGITVSDGVYSQTEYFEVDVN
jgi:streptogramin lyase